MSLESYKNSTFVKAVFAFDHYQFDFTSSKSLLSVNIQQTLSTNNAGSNVGSGVSGVIQVADYYEDLFTLLSAISSTMSKNNLERLVNSANADSMSINHPTTVAKGDGKLGTIAVGMKCYSGTRIWFMSVKSWSYSFGTPSTITFTCDQTDVGDNENVFSELMFDFGTYRADDPRNAANINSQNIKYAVEELQNSSVIDTAFSGDVITEMPKGVVGPKFEDPVEALTYVSELYHTDIRFTTSDLKEFKNLKDFVADLKKSGESLFFRNGVYELKTFSSSVSASEKSAEETEFDAIIRTIFSAKSKDADPKVTYEPKVHMTEKGRYLTAVKIDNQPVADKEGIDLALDRVVFFYNAPKPLTGLWNNKVVIPLNSLSASISSEAMIDSAFKVTDTPNGTMVFTPSGRYMTNENSTGIYMRLATIAMHNTKGGFKISMNCNNYIHWENNVKAYAEIYSYTSNGLPGVVQGKYLIQSAAISWSGGVVSSTVELIKEAPITESASQSIQEGGSNLNEVYNKSALKSQVNIMKQVVEQFNTGDFPEDLTTDAIPSEDCGSPDFSQEVPMEDNAFKAYLCSKDSVPVPITLDKTVANMSNGKFDRAVAEAVKIQKETGKRSFSFNSELFQKHIIEEGNYGLLCLLLAVANWGMTEVPTDLKDPLKFCSIHSKRTPWFAPNAGNGKGFFDYKSGGLGIAHWDTSNLHEIYTIWGFQKKYQTDSMLKLLYTRNNTPGVNLRWVPITNHITGRTDFSKPLFMNTDKKQTPPRLFDKGLSAVFLSKVPSSKPWQDWAEESLNYQDSQGLFPFQTVLSRLWVDSFWKRTVSKLPQGTLNDAFRIARAGNSASGLINICCQNGKAISVERQYECYLGGTKEVHGKIIPKCDTERYMNQKGFCRRCGDLIGYLYSKGKLPTA